MPEPVDTSNKWGVRLFQAQIGFVNCPPKLRLEKDEALVLAAWLVALADPEGTRFPEIFRKIKDT